MTAALLLTFLLQAAQDPPTWRTDVAKARQDCVEARKPCVVIVNVDRDTTSKGSVEWHLRRSPEFRALCSTVTVAIMRQYEEAGIELMKELEGSHFAPCKIAVLDRVGEFLGYFFAWEELEHGRASAEEAFAAKLVERIQVCLKRKDSLQNLERRWQKEQEDPRLLDELLDRLTEFSRSNDASEIALKVADDGKLSKEVRNIGRAWDYSFPDPNDIGDTRRAALQAEGEALLVEVADFAAATPLLDVLMEGYYAVQFDVPAKVAAAKARLEKLAASQKDPAPLRKRIKELDALFKEWKDGLEHDLKEYGPDEDAETRGRAMALLGDAPAAIKILGALPEKERQPYDAWLEEARAKLKK